MDCCKQKRLDTNKIDGMQTKKMGCNQKIKTCHDANKNDRMQTKNIECKQERRMQTKKDLQTIKKME